MVNDWKTGSRGWIVWISLAIMLADSVVSITFLTVTTASPWLRAKLLHLRLGHFFGTRSSGFRLLTSQEHDCHDTQERAGDTGQNILEDAPSREQVDCKTFAIALTLSIALCLASVKYCFPQVPAGLVIVALAVAFVLSVVAVRALGLCALFSRCKVFWTDWHTCLISRSD
jgi:hypothetical protein